MAHTVYIRGIPENKNIKNVAVREAPGVNQKERFRADIGLKATCSEVKSDLGNDGFNGQVYKWFFLTFEDGRNGWVRDDLLELEGDLTAIGYAVYTTRTYAFTAVHQVVAVVTTSITPPKSDPVAPTPAVSVPAPQPQQPAAPAGYDITVNTKARVRSRPTTTGQQIGSFEPGTTIKAFALEAGQDGQAYRWARVLVNNLTGYIREDLVNFSPEAAKAFGIGAAAPVTTPAPTTVPTPTPSQNVGTFKLQWPVRQHTINQNFMENRFFDYSQFGHPGHEGIDFPVGNGTEIFACADGVVDLVDLRGTTPFEAAYGTHLWIRHDHGGAVYRTLYAHLSEIRVSQGQRVTAGQLVALSGNTGRSTGPHLHFSLKKVGASNARETTYEVVGDLIKVPNTSILWRRGDRGTFKWDYIDPTPYLTPPPANIPVKRVQQ
jgi:murein DD-endopeptidase MepM/ murein hydrolase activator NlpD